MLLVGWIQLAWGGERVISGNEIANELTSSAGGDKFKVRPFMPRANPDTAKRVCYPQLNQQLLAPTKTRGELLTRTLYVEAAPKNDCDVQCRLGEAELLPAGVEQPEALGSAPHDPRLLKRFVVAGHTDALGSAEYNDRLSCERALAARRYLHEKFAIDAQMLVSIGLAFTT